MCVVGTHKRGYENMKSTGYHPPPPPIKNEQENLITFEYS
jgi:hypothetical protein